MEAAEPGHPRRMLVVANKTCPCTELHEYVRRRAGGAADEVLVVAPALNSRLKHLVTDVDDAVAAARDRLETAVDELTARGVHARGEVGDAQPLQAIEDALYDFDAHEVIVSTHPPGESHWLESNLIERAREAVDVPVAHVVSKYGLEADAITQGNARSSRPYGHRV
jgi:hypothetical protein